jgi:hypothetical protein
MTSRVLLSFFVFTMVMSASSAGIARGNRTARTPDRA